MKAETILKSNLNKKQIIYIGIAVTFTIIAIVVMGAIIYFQQTPDTQASSEGPQNVQVQNIAPDQAKVQWSTGSEAVTAIEYGTSADAATFTTLPVSASPSTEHSIDLSSLTPNSTYYFQIRVGETVYDNGGQFWTFSSGTGGSDVTPDASASGTVIPTSPVSIIPTPDLSITDSLDLSTTPAITSATGGGSCPYTSCSQIQANLGTVCTTQDYVRCLFTGDTTTDTTTDTDTDTTTDTSTDTTTSTSLATGVIIPQSTKNICALNFIQANNCTSWSWESLANKNKVCSQTFTRYFVQCKSNSFGSTDSSFWYCNETTTDNSITLPCTGAPTPAAGQSVFCRVRAETDEGGAINSSGWIYGNSSCNAYTSSNIGTCQISYLQSNNCRSWIWDLINSKDPTCQASFSKYFFQCNSNGNFALTTTTPTPAFWYCNSTSDNHYLDFPCYNAITPADGVPITCRVRAEDAVGGDSHSTAWTTTAINCPTSTPTPSITATPTSTPTPTRTPTPTPTP